MLIKTVDNQLNVMYIQNVNTNKITSKKKEYEYKEINIPVELLNYWKIFKPEGIDTIGYVVSLYGGLMTTFLTPFTAEEIPDEMLKEDISILHNAPEVVTPYKIIPIKVRKRGKVDNPKYFIRVDSKQFKLLTNYVEFIVNPYIDDPYLKTKGLVSISNLVLL